MLVLQGAAPGAAAVCWVFVMGAVAEPAGQRLRVLARRGERFLVLGEPAEETWGAGCAPRALISTRGGVQLGVGEG